MRIAHWKSQFFEQDDSKLTGATLHLIERQRNGDEIDQDLIKIVVHSFVALGLDSIDPNKECLAVYKEHFETPFIQATGLYYKKESQVFLAENTVSDYLKKAQEWLRKEEDRVERYLHTNTRKELIAKCEDVLIRQYAHLIQDTSQKLLDEDFQRACDLLARIPGGLEPLTKRFEAEVTHAGLSAVSKIVREGDAINSVDQNVYVDAVIEVHHHHSEMVIWRYKRHAGFRASFDKACREFVNRNAATGSSPTKSAELLAKYADTLLRKRSKMGEEEDLEDALNRVVRCSVIF